MSSTVKLMTSNLLAGKADPIAFRDLLDHHDPDVVVTQELGYAQADVLVDLYPFHHLVPTDEFHGRGVATRLNAEFSEIPMPERAGTTATFEIDGVGWDLAGVHLPNPVNFPQWRAVRARGLQLRAIEQWGQERGAGPVVVAGDFNASPRWPAYKRMVAGWADLVADRAADDLGPERTWAWRPGWPRMLRIDHVFGRAVRAESVVVVPVAGSDHHAVIVSLVAI